jgi:MYND finger
MLPLMIWTLLSRAADDHRKKQPIVSSTVDTNSSSSGNASSDSSSSVAGSVTAHSVSDTVQGTRGTDTDSGVDATTSDASCGIDATTAAEAAAKGSATSAVAAAGCDPADGGKARKVKQPCANCSRLTTKLCRRCAAVYYCSVECQKVCFADPRHRAQCEATAAQTL